MQGDQHLVHLVQLQCHLWIRSAGQEQGPGDSEEVLQCCSQLWILVILVIMQCLMWCRVTTENSH